MQNLIRYCCDKGLNNFQIFKFERKSRIIMREHFVSKKDVEKYKLLPYLIIDKYGRYKIPKYFLKQFSDIIIQTKYYFFLEMKNNRIYSYNINDVKEMILNPSCDRIKESLKNIEKNFDKDPIRHRILKISQIKERIK